MHVCESKGNGWRLEAVGVCEVRKHQERDYLTALTDTSDRAGVRGRENQDWMGKILSCLFFKGVGRSWSLIGEQEYVSDSLCSA